MKTKPLLYAAGAAVVAYFAYRAYTSNADATAAAAASATAAQLFAQQQASAATARAASVQARQLQIQQYNHQQKLNQWYATRQAQQNADQLNRSQWFAQDAVRRAALTPAQLQAENAARDKQRFLVGGRIPDPVAFPAGVPPANTVLPL